MRDTRSMSVAITYRFKKMRLYSAAFAVLCTALVLDTGFAATPVQSSEPKFHLDIPAQKLDDALQSLAIVSQHKLLYSTKLVHGKNSPRLKGEFTTEEAVGRLLSKTDLIYQITADGLVMIRSPGLQSSAAVEAPTEIEPVRIAQSGQDSKTTSETPATVSTENQTPSDPTKDLKDLMTEIVVVTGSRLTQRGQGAQPVRAYSKDDIARSGQTSVADFLNTLPEVSIASFDSPTVNYANQTTVQLHGLPQGTTLILLNGRRVATNNYGIFDLNNIPASVIERIDVLPVGSSAVYGADSLAGVVNIILRDDFDQVETEVKYGQAEDMDEKNVSFAWGKTWQRASASIVASYQERGELLAGDRSFASDPLLPSLPLDGCNPATVYSLNGGNLPGLSSSHASIRAGVVGVPTTQDFIPLVSPVTGCSYVQDIALLSRSKREGVLASAEYRLTPSTELFAEVLASHEKVPSKTGAILSFYNDFGDVLPATNAFNPFGEDVGVSYSYRQLPSIYERTSTFVRPLLGIRGSLGANWNYEVTGFASRDRTRVVQGDRNVDAVGSALASSDPLAALNPFTTGAPASPALLSSFVISSPTRVEVEMLQGQAVVRGSLFTLPTGSVGTVFGVEYQRDKLMTDIQDTNISGEVANSGRIARSVFAETRVPLVASSSNFDRLAVTMAARLDSPSDFDSKATGQAALEWHPNDALLIRGGYGTAYKAPQLNQLHGARNLAPVDGQYSDPFRGDETVASVPVSQGPNPGLRAENGSSRSLGFVYSSTSIPGLQASLTYWGTRIEDFIGIHEGQALIDHPELFPGAVSRAAPSPEDIANGYLGPIVLIDSSYKNFGSLRVDGIDFDARYEIETRVGTLVSGVSVSRVGRYDSSLAPGEPSESLLNQAALSGFAPRWKGTASMQLLRGAFSAGLSSRFVGSYNDYLGFSGEYPHDIGKFWLFDASLRYDAGDGFSSTSSVLGGFYGALGAVNLFDKAPKASYYYYGYDIQQGDVRGRFIYAQLGWRY